MIVNTTERWSARIALMVAHCAGMVDLVALPVWVGTLIERYQLSPQQAGGLVTLFLLGAVASSLFFAPRFDRVHPRLAATAGFTVAAGAFLAVSFAQGLPQMAVLHAIAGAAAACGLSFTHGSIGRSPRPHRLFALVGMALGVFAIVFLGTTPKLVELGGGPVLFRIFAGLMLAAGRPRLTAPVLFGALGIACMALVQAMMFSFLERIGVERGFGSSGITGVLIALGVVNLFPAPLAAWLETRWRVSSVLLCGPVVQVALALLITQSSGFTPYAAGGIFFAAVMIFTHTFAFGMLAVLEPTGRILAATPAMLMTGSAIGPFLGGTLVQGFGYGALGLACAVIGAAALACFFRAAAGLRGAIPITNY